MRRPSMDNIGDESIEKLRQAMAVLNEWVDRTEAELEAELEATPPVTLHEIIGDAECRFYAIKKIRQDAPMPSGRLVCAIFGDYEVNGEMLLSMHTWVGETAAEITAKARAAWGAEWSVPGAEPPVAVVEEREPEKPNMAKLQERVAELEDREGTLNAAVEYWKEKARDWEKQSTANVEAEVLAEVLAIYRRPVSEIEQDMVVMEANWPYQALKRQWLNWAKKEAQVALEEADDADLRLWMHVHGWQDDDD
jgi:hypothetical protein